MCERLLFAPKEGDVVDAKEGASSSSLRNVRANERRRGLGGSVLASFAKRRPRRVYVFCSCKNSVVVAQEEPLSSLRIVGEQNGAGGLSLSLCGLALMTHANCRARAGLGSFPKEIWGFPPRAKHSFFIYANL